MVDVRNVNLPGYRARLQKDKYDAMKKALLAVLPAAAPGYTQSEMLDAVLPHLPKDLFPDASKAMWWLKSVQLDLEARRVMVRDRTAKPLRWRKA